MSPLEACRAAFPALEWTALNGGGYRGWVVVGEVPSVSLGQVMAGPSKGKWFAMLAGTVSRQTHVHDSPLKALEALWKVLDEAHRQLSAILEEAT